MAGAARGLPRPSDLLAIASQRFDHAASRLGAGLQRNVAAHERDLARIASPLKLGLLQRHTTIERDRLGRLAVRLKPAAERGFARAAERLAALGQLHRSLDPDRPLERGFARVERAGGALARSAKALSPGEAVQLVFADGRRSAVVDGKSVPRGKTAAPDQGDLF